MTLRPAATASNLPSLSILILALASKSPVEGKTEGARQAVLIERNITYRWHF